MVGDETNPHPIQILVSYWKMRPSALASRLDDLIREGITHIATFVPWQAVESDISHSLPKFLQAVADRNLTVSLIVTPEVGLNYPNSGIPKDLVMKQENAARDARGGFIPALLPPNAFALPSLLAPEIAKRYTNFLLRLDGILGDALKSHPSLTRKVRAVVTGSFWKYYRTADRQVGDFSGGASLAYRQRIESFFSQREFGPEPGTPGAGDGRWKTRMHEDFNRRWFYQHGEDVFRQKTVQYLRRKAASLEIQHAELHTPEAAIESTYSRALQLATGGKADFGRFARALDQAAKLRTFAVASGEGARAAAPLVHWTELGGFRTLADSEKQFLLIKSLVLFAARGGGLLIDESEYRALSAGFRARAESLARLIRQKTTPTRREITYLSSHLWSSDGAIWSCLSERATVHVSRVASLDLALSDHESALLIVDPTVILTRDHVARLAAWAKAGRVVALPRSSLYTDAARFELEEILTSSASARGRVGQPIEMRHGTTFRLVPWGDGKVIVYDLQSANGDWSPFVSSLLGLAGVQTHCSISDSRVQTLWLEKERGGVGMFVLNATNQPLTADIQFSNEVSISDLASSLWAHPANRDSSTTLSSRFSLEVPPFGVLPMSVDGLGIEARERAEAERSSELTLKGAEEAAMSELPGFTWS